MKITQLVLASRPHGLPSSENFRFEDRGTGKLNDDEILLKTWFISVDPYTSGRMNDVKSYATSFPIDQPMSKGIVAKAIATFGSKRMDVYYDHAGGKITNTVINNLNFHSRIVLGGQISSYNSTGIPVRSGAFPQILTKSALVQDFIIGNFSETFGEPYSYLTQLIKQGKIKYTHTIIQGFERLPDAFIALFSGKKREKMLVQ